MKLTWYGHSCFLVESAEGSALFDPYAPESVPGWRLPPLTADMVLASHGHADHSYAAGVALTGRKSGFRVTELSAFHDDQQGRKRGENVIRVIESEGLRVAHLGDLGHGLTSALTDALQNLDVLLLPVGGFYTIGPREAMQIVEELKPRCTVPMHYSGRGFGYGVIAPVEDFLQLAGSYTRLQTNSMTVGDYSGVVVLTANNHD